MLYAHIIGRFLLHAGSLQTLPVSPGVCGV